MISGFLNLNKPSGESSNKALFAVKKVLRQQKLDVKVGHLGTLDPLACGVLPVAIGRATRLFDFMLDKTKVYRARFTFGVTSDSLDPATPLIPVEGEKVTENAIQAALPDFIGKLQQVPPNYSAKNVGGVRAYRLARKGKDFTLPAKEVEVYSFDLVRKTDENTYEFLIECSSGTYIRSLARDLGAAVGSAAIMSYLCREKSGIFTLKNSHMEEEILAEPEKFVSFLIPTEEALLSLPKRVLVGDEEKVLNGIGIPTEFAGKQRVYLSDGTLVGIGECDDEGLLKIKTRLL